jgi:hypothetical protein
MLRIQKSMGFHAIRLSNALASGVPGSLLAAIR